MFLPPCSLFHVGYSLKQRMTDVNVNIGITELRGQETIIIGKLRENAQNRCERSEAIEI